MPLASTDLLSASSSPSLPSAPCFACGEEAEDAEVSCSSRHTSREDIRSLKLDGYEDTGRSSDVSRAVVGNALSRICGVESVTKGAT